MFAFMGKTDILKRLFIGFMAFFFIFTIATCDLPMGLGDPIDWEPPVLTLEPLPPNPYYVGLGATLSGTVTDNIGVDRVILRMAGGTEEIFRAKLNKEQWVIELNFDESQNGEKLAVEVVAFDKRGNSGDTSIVAVTLIIDIRPPIIEDTWIQRTDVKRGELEPYTALKALETMDPNGERSANANRYQNGWFYIDGTVAETETRIDIVSLNIYDARDPDTALLVLEKLKDSSTFNPRWLISEEALLAAGDALVTDKWSAYSANYRNGQRYYYRVTITAYDRGDNESEYHENFYLGNLRVEEQGFFCMWQNADAPKGTLDASLRIISSGTKASPVIIQKGSTLPIEFFDDDQLLYAYTGLLTIEQWDGTADIASGTTIPAGTDESKILWLRDRLLNDTGDVYNWRYDRYFSTDDDHTKNLISNEISAKIDEKLVYVQTGAQEKDNGEYVLFSLAADEKLPPHPNPGDANYKDLVTNKTWENFDIWYVSVIDENEPLIVFDVVNTTDASYKIQGTNGKTPEQTHPGGEILEPLGPAYRTGNSPVDNTFPKLTDGQYFEINGYTLRLDNSGASENEVKYFRMAWIPYGIAGGADSYISRVQDALKSLSYPTATGSGGSMAALEALGVQHWNFTVKASAGAPESGALITGSPQILGTDTTDTYKKQVFRKTFDVLGGPDDKKPAYNNFTVGSIRENETKLFIIYVEDGMGHIVFRQLRILGNKTPPTLTVYDITGRNVNFLNSPRELPNLNNDKKSDPHNQTWDDNYYFFDGPNITDDGRERYENSLLLYQPQGYQSIVNSGAHSGLSDGDRTEPYQPYPRDTIIKYWVTAARSGDLNVSNINMMDITYSTNNRAVGHFNGTNALSYVEMLPEVTQRVFLFEATDTLGNVARIQRTVAVTNAAMLNNITTTTQSGSYGITSASNPTTITLQANFSNLVLWTGTNPPLLNVRYTHNGEQVISQIPTKTPPSTLTNPIASLSLDFDFEIHEGCTGELETMYINIGGPTDTGKKGGDVDQNNRPITLPAGTQILDATRGDTAFTPGNVLGFNWTWDASGHGKSLQGQKTIILDGIRPTITSFTFDYAGKTRYTDGNPGYFYKTDDTLKFTLTADKDIFTSGSPIIQLEIGNNQWHNVPWQSSTTAKTMVFSVQVPSGTAIPEGSVARIRLNNVSTIVDNVGNAFSGTAGTYSSTAMNNISTGYNVITIDKTTPPAPVTRIGSRSVPFNNTTFTSNPALEIDTSVSGDDTATATIEYSLNNGVSWQPYLPGPAGTNTISNTNGPITVVTRYTDRAGNVGTPRSQIVDVNAKFPDLKSITAVQPDGFYPRTGATTLEFDLTFDAAVWTDSTAGVTITLTNRNTPNSHNTGGATDTIEGVNYQSFAKLLTATAVTQANANTTIRFAWTGITGKEMLNGLYVSNVNFTGLRDRFGNQGGLGTASITGTTPTNLSISIQGYPDNTCANLSGAGLKVDCIAPRITAYAPATPSGGGVGNVIPVTAGIKNRTITLTFNEKMSKGSGTITVRPRGNYAIPAVFENNGYYLGTDGNRYSNPSATTIPTTYVDGFYDVYNKTTTPAQKNYLTQSANNSPNFNTLNTTNPDMNSLRLNERTGQSYGPYKRTTHGLIQGAGYTGNGTATGANGPNPTQANSMIPDTSTKWVLDYQYLINDTVANSAVTNIRTTLNQIKFRWQEIDVTSSNVSIGGTGANEGRVVTITLPEPLLDGLQWDLYYPAGTFTDEAGNNAPAIAETGYWFWSSGVQAPVIRVNRRSFDARTSNWQSATRTYGNPANTNNWNTDGIAITDADGWGLTDFNVVHYRVESETPGASLYRYVSRGTPANNGAVNGAWTGNVFAANSGATVVADAAWNATTATNGAWVLQNLIRRAGANLTYTVSENGITITRTKSGNGNYQGLRSYNRDILKSVLDTEADTGTNLAQLTANNRQSSILYNPASGTITDTPSYEASKNYIVAEARITNGGIDYKLRSYEGVFRSVIMLNQNTYAGNFGTVNNWPESNGARMALVTGSNVKGGMPSIAGFPVRDANNETGMNNSFIKVYHYTNVSATSGRFFWVSTEIVSQWYQISYGQSFFATGEVENYLTAGYGDLTYSYNQQ